MPDNSTPQPKLNESHIELLCHIVELDKAGTPMRFDSISPGSKHAHLLQDLYTTRLIRTPIEPPAVCIPTIKGYALRDSAHADCDTIILNATRFEALEQSDTWGGNPKHGYLLAHTIYPTLAELADAIIERDGGLDGP